MIGCISETQYGGTYRFADHGDSGAAVWKQLGAWVGVVFGGTTVAQLQVDDELYSDHITWITPAEAIVDHIKRLGREVFNPPQDFKVELFK